MNKEEDKSVYDYTERAESCEPDDFWGQVRRTINGKPVGEDQILLICDAIDNGLDMQQTDNIVDIGCGNGALTCRFKDKVSHMLGIDRSEYLINVAKENFSFDNIEYHNGDALDVMKSIPDKTKYNKAMLYGVFSFFNDFDSKLLLEFLMNEMNIDTVFLGNVRDRELATKFYGRDVSAIELDDHQSSMGVWRDREYFIEICNENKWSVDFFKMPKEFYANEYYFDVRISKK